MFPSRWLCPRVSVSSPPRPDSVVLPFFCLCGQFMCSNGFGFTLRSLGKCPSPGRTQRNPCATGSRLWWTPCLAGLACSLPPPLLHIEARRSISFCCPSRTPSCPPSMLANHLRQDVCLGTFVSAYCVRMPPWSRQFIPRCRKTALGGLRCAIAL